MDFIGSVGCAFHDAILFCRFVHQMSNVVLFLMAGDVLGLGYTKKCMKLLPSVVFMTSDEDTVVPRSDHKIFMKARKRIFFNWCSCIRLSVVYHSAKCLRIGSQEPVLHELSLAALQLMARYQ